MPAEDAARAQTPAPKASPAAAPKWNYEMLFLQALAIFSMVMGHCGHLIPVLYNAVFPYYSWHMPFFMFVSGYFLKATGRQAAYVQKKCKTLLLPALGVHLFFLGLSVAMRQSGLIAQGGEITLYAVFIDPFVSYSRSVFDFALWFVFQLFVVEMLVSPLVRIRWRPFAKWLPLGSLVLCLGALYWVTCILESAPTGLGLFLSRTCFLQFFFVVGYCYRTRWEGKWPLRHGALLAGVVLVQATYLALSGADIKFSAVSMNMAKTPAFFSPVVTSLSATLALLCVAKLLSPLLQGNRVVLWFGANGKAVVYFHQLCVLLVNCVYMVLTHRFHLAALAGFQHDVIRAGWYAFPLHESPLGQLPYVVVSLVAPIAISRGIGRAPKRWMRMALWFLAGVGVAVFLMVMGKYAVEAVGLSYNPLWPK